MNLISGWLHFYLMIITLIIGLLFIYCPQEKKNVSFRIGLLLLITAGFIGGRGWEMHSLAKEVRVEEIAGAVSGTAKAEIKINYTRGDLISVELIPGTTKTNR